MKRYSILLGALSFLACTDELPSPTTNDNWDGGPIAIVAEEDAAGSEDAATEDLAVEKDAAVPVDGIKGPQLTTSATYEMNPALKFGPSTNAVKIFKPAVASGTSGVVYAPSIFGPYIARVDSAGQVSHLDSGFNNNSLKTMVASELALFVLSWDDKEIHRIDLASSAQTHQASCAGSYLYQSKEHLYCAEASGGANSSAQLRVFKKTDLTEVTTAVNLGIAPGLVAVNDASKQIRILGFVDTKDLAAVSVVTLNLDGSTGTTAAKDYTLSKPLASVSGATNVHAYDPTTDRSYLRTKTSVDIIDHLTQTVTTLPLDFSDPDIAQSSRIFTFGGKVVLLTEGDATGTDQEPLGIIATFDGSTGQKLAVQTLAGKEFTGASDFAQQRLIVSSMDTTSLHLIDPAVGTDTAIDVGNTSEGSLGHPSGRYVYSLNRLGGSSLHIYDADTQTASDLPLPLWPKWAHISGKGNELYVVSHLGAAISIIDINKQSPTLHTLQKTVNLTEKKNATDAIGSSAINQPDHKIYVSHPEQGLVTVFDSVGAKVSHTLEVVPLVGMKFTAPGHMQLAYDEKTKVLAIYSRGAKRLFLYDAQTYELKSDSDLSTTVKIPSGHYRNNVLFADTEHDRLWIGPYAFDLGGQLIPNLLGQTASTLTQRVLGYDAASDAYLVAALGDSTEDDSFSVLDGTTFKIRQSTPLTVDRLLPLEPTFQPSTKKIFVSIHNAATVRTLEYK